MEANNTNAAYLAERPFDPEALRVLPKEAVTFKYFTDQPEYSASWDLCVTKEGRIFFPLCAEIFYPMMVRLYEYIPEKDEFRLCFNIEDVTFQQDRAIRTSKIHTSIEEIEDGRLIMTTHTTARSPYHPDWMPFAYHGHPWEGYQGSHILIYDYHTGKVENKGIPVPFESIYGAKYDRYHNCLYFIGYLKGHLYRYDLDTNRITDYGKVTEYGAYRICEGPDGNFYSCSRGGNFFRINTRTQEIEELGIEVPNNNGKYSDLIRWIGFSAIVNHKLYLRFSAVKGLYCYEPERNSLEYVGEMKPRNFGNYIQKEEQDYWRDWIFGLTADDKGCLWYTYDLGGLHLCRIDVLHGGEPEDMGLIGVQERAVADSAAELIYQDGRLYCGSTNHMLDGPGVAVIDLAKLEEARAKGVKGEISGDAWIYLKLARISEVSEFPYEPADGVEPVPLKSFYPGEDLEKDIKSYIDDEINSSGYVEIRKANPHAFQAKRLDAVLLWRLLSVEKSRVYGLKWTDEHTLIVQAGDPAGAKLQLVLKDGQIAERKSIDAFTEKKIPECLRKLEYPCYPGRQYKAVPNAFAPWKDGSYLVGTLDGMLALVRTDGSVFSLGSAASNGPIHEICVNKDLTKAYGVAGDQNDLGNIFSYDDRQGLRWRGTVFREDIEEGMTLSGDQLYRIALSPDERTLAVGTVDRLGAVYLYTLE